MIRLTHHTSIQALDSIIKDKHLYPIFDVCVWFTANEEGENTAMGMFPERARIVVEIPEVNVIKFHDIASEFSHLDLKMLNLITNTDLWYVSFEPVSAEYFVSVDVFKDGKWSKYDGGVNE